MRNKFLLLMILTTLLSCRKYCEQYLIHGEILRIPVEFKNFSTNELNNINVYRIDKDSTNKKDTFNLIYIVFNNQIRSNNVEITDRDRLNRFGYYESYFDSCDLVFDWYTGRDTFKNMQVLKSKNVIDDKCHKDDPNVKIDHLSFSHKGKIISKDEAVIIEK